MRDLIRFSHLLRLKEVSRMTRVSDRRESPAEHTWSALVLADFLLGRVKAPVDRHRVFELLLYHDVVEIEAGDTFELGGESAERQEERERSALASMRGTLPADTWRTCASAYEEYRRYETVESRFAQAVDKLEPMINQLSYRGEWRKYGYTVKALGEKKRPFMAPFPELLELYESFIEYLRRNDYVDEG
jgi:putative hydrolase of HD superfamily